jgi:hypothetical protein
LAGWALLIKRDRRNSQMSDLVDVLIEAQSDLDWCTDPSELERALIRLVDLEPRDHVAVPLQQKIAQLRLVAELGRVTQH